MGEPRVPPRRDSVCRVEIVELGGAACVSRVGLGCNNFGGRIGADETRAVVEAALDAGVTFFDTAESYGEATAGASGSWARSSRAVGSTW